MNFKAMQDYPYPISSSLSCWVSALALALGSIDMDGALAVLANGYG
jgi:hypothetical protein